MADITLSLHPTEVPDWANEDLLTGQLGAPVRDLTEEEARAMLNLIALRLPAVLSAHLWTLSLLNPVNWPVILAETGLAIFALPTPHGLARPAQSVLAIIAFTVVLWIFQVMNNPSSVPATHPTMPSSSP